MCDATSYLDFHRLQMYVRIYLMLPDFTLLLDSFETESMLVLMFASLF